MMPSGNSEVYANANSKDQYGNFVIDLDNNPRKVANGYGWKPAPGKTSPISVNYRGEHPLPGYKQWW
jgi:hypothetical protein